METQKFVKKLTAEQQQMVVDNQNLVYAVYRNAYPNPSTVVRKWREEIIQEGMFGLCLAALNFDPERCNQFTTFAVPCIRHQMGLLVRKVRNDWMVDSLDEIINNDEEDNGITRLDMLADSSISTECIISNQQDKELALQILEGAPERIRFAITQILTQNMRVLDVYLQFYADKSYHNVVQTIGIGCRRIRYILHNVPLALIPKEINYISREGFLTDMRRLWKSHKPSAFKPRLSLLKTYEEREQK